MQAIRPHEQIGYSCWILFVGYSWKMTRAENRIKWRGKAQLKAWRDSSSEGDVVAEKMLEVAEPVPSSCKGVDH